MPIQPRPLLVLRHYTIQRIAHIGAHILIPVFVQAQRAGRVLDEEVQDADFVGAEFGERGGYVVGY